MSIKYYWSKLFKKLRGSAIKNSSIHKISKIEINPIIGKSINKSFVDTRKEKSYKIPNYETMVEEMKEWMLNHQELYKHYNLINN